MKRPRLLPTLAILLIFALASAQIVIERLNEGDPKESTASGSDDDEGSDEGSATPLFEGEGDEFTSKELAEIHKAIVPALKKAHKKCLKSPAILSPEKAKISGNAVFTVTEKGTAAFAGGTCDISEDAFFDASLRKALSAAEIAAATKKGKGMYSDCVKPADAKTDVKGKNGQVSVAYSVTVSKTDVSITLE